MRRLGGWREKEDRVLELRGNGLVMKKVQNV